MFFDKSDMETGWSETYYSTMPDIASAGTAFDTLCQARMGVALDSVAMMGRRICNMDSQRDGYMGGPVPNFAVGQLPGSTFHSTGLGDALLMRMDTPAYIAFNHKFLHFPPQEVFVGRQYNQTNAPPPWIPNWTAWVSAVTSGQWSVIRQTGHGQTPILQPCANASALRLVTRRLGRPFGLLRGRRTVA
jgi:hypothetical protein